MPPAAHAFARMIIIIRVSIYQASKRACAYIVNTDQDLHLIMNALRGSSPISKGKVRKELLSTCRDSNAGSDWGFEGECESDTTKPKRAMSISVRCWTTIHLTQIKTQLCTRLRHADSLTHAITLHQKGSQIAVEFVAGHVEGFQALERVPLPQRRVCVCVCAVR